MLSEEKIRQLLLSIESSIDRWEIQLEAEKVRKKRIEIVDHIYRLQIEATVLINILNG